MAKETDPKYSSRGLLQVTNPQDPSGGYKVVTLTTDKKYNVTGQVMNGGPNEVIDDNEVWCKDEIVATEVQGVSGGTNFNFSNVNVQSEYGLRKFQARCIYRDNTTDDDDQMCVAMPQKLRVDLSQTPLSNNNCNTCTKANTAFELTFGLGPTDPPWKWGFQITDSANFICGCAFLSIVITTNEPNDKGTILFSIKSDFDAETSLGKYMLSPWDFTFPAGGVSVPKLTSNNFFCGWPPSIKVNPA